MKMQGEDGASAGHAGLIDMMNDIFAPGKEYTKEQKQYDERVGRKATTNSGKPLDFGENKINIVVSEQAEVAGSPAGEVSTSVRADRPHRKRQK
jgi:hypothetical protein